MCIATRSGVTRRPHSLPANAAASSRLDHVLAPLADLGDAIRDEIAVSLAPMARELETALKQISTLEARVRDLEARLAAAAAALGPASPASRPDKPSLSTATVTEAGPQARAEFPARKRRPRRHPVQGGVIAAPAPVSPAAAGPAARPPTVDASVGETSVRARLVQPINDPSEPTEVAATATNTAPPGLDATPGFASTPPPTAPVPGSIWRPEHSSNADDRCGNAPARAQRSETAPMLGHAEPASVMSGPPGVAASPNADTNESMEFGARAAPRDRATGTLDPLLEQGAREMIAFGLYPDMEALLNEAVFRLIESDYPAVQGGGGGTGRDKAIGLADGIGSGVPARSPGMGRRRALR